MLRERPATIPMIFLPPRNDVPPQAVILEMWSGYVFSRALHVVAERAIADHLADRPKTAAELAGDTGANEEALHRVLQMLASRSVFAEEESGRFGLTPLSECLRSGAVGSVRDTIRMYGEMHWSAMGNLLHSVMTGEPAFDEVAGSPVWEYLRSHPDDDERFARVMTVHLDHLLVPPLNRESLGGEPES